MLEALIFDVDGTLADTERQGHRVAFNLAFQEVGLDWQWDEALYGRLLSVTGGKERLRYFIERFLAKPPVPATALDAFIEDLQARKTRHYTRLVEGGRIPARPGVIRLIKEAKARGLRLGIATTTSPENVDALLKASFAVDAPQWFEVIGAGDIVPQKKPAPDIYHYVLTAMNLPASACLALEDSQNGLRAALGAGIPTLVTVNDYTLGQDFRGALLVANHLGDPGQPLTCLSPVPWENLSMIDIDTLEQLHARALNVGCAA